MRHFQAFAIPLLLASSAACSQPASVETGRAAANQEQVDVQDSSPGNPVSGLPFSQGHSFASLDEYLAFLRKRGAYDVPWYREVRPGVYELVSRRGPGAQPQIFTREELEKKFGFAR
jgi:hypothetical protein